MRTVISSISFLIVFLSISCKNEKVKIDIISGIDAPFDMPDISIPNFKDCKKLIITEFGAVLGNQSKTSEAIRKAIHKANALGGGVVVIPKGEWLTGKIHLKSNVNLHISEGATLLFSDNPNDYLPVVKTTWEGMQCYNYSPLIFANNCKNIAITGKGILKAKMKTWEKWFARPKAHMDASAKLYHLSAKNPVVEDRQMVVEKANMRPQFIQFYRSENIVLEGVSIENSPFWVIHPFLSKNIVIRNVKVKAHGHNNDGVDPEMSQNILIENCVFDQGDDAIAVKSGRNQDAWRLNTPSKNIVIRNCLVKNGHQLLAIGSELSGGVENVFMENCKVTEEAKSSLNHLIFIKTNERRGGYVKNIYMKNIKAGKVKLGVLGIETDVLYQWRNLVPTYERKLTTIENINLSEINISEAQFVSRILGQKEAPINKVTLDRIAVNKVLKDSIIHENVKGFSWNNE